MRATLEARIDDGLVNAYWSLPADQFVEFRWIAVQILGSKKASIRGLALVGRSEIVHYYRDGHIVRRSRV